MRQVPPAGFRRHRMERPRHHDRQFYKRDRGVANFGKNPQLIDSA